MIQGDLENKIWSYTSHLENQIWSHISQTGKDATLIVMHPKTWEDLCNSVWKNEKIRGYDHDPSTSLSYKGITVLRSLDMVDGLFEVR